MSALSDLYANGEGVNKDLILATDWSRKAKHAGRTAKFDIEITTVNTNKQSNLVTHWQQKADLGDVDALYRLARIYDDGVITTHNLDIAVNYYKKAANAGHAMSQYTLGYLYCRGEGVKKDIEKSNQWLSKYSTELHCHYFKDEK